MEIEMHVEMAILAGLLPKCDLCQWEFNLVERVPFTMSCCHSLCWSCLGEVLRSRRERKRFRRRTRMKCPICARKPVKYLLNHCVLGILLRLHALSAELVLCNQCLRRVSFRHLRRCVTCEREVMQRTTLCLQVCCQICLECIIGTHRTHDLESISARQKNSAATLTNTSTCSSSMNTASPSSAEQQMPKSSATIPLQITPLFRRPAKASTRKGNRKEKDSMDENDGRRQLGAFPRKLLRGVVDDFTSLFGKFSSSICPSEDKPFAAVVPSLQKPPQPSAAINYGQRHFLFTEMFEKDHTRHDSTGNNFLWNIGCQAATVPPFLRGSAADDKMSSRRMATLSAKDRHLRRDMPRPMKMEVKNVRLPPTASTNSSTFQLIAGDLLLGGAGGGHYGSGSLATYASTESLFPSNTNNSGSPLKKFSYSNGEFLSRTYTNVYNSNVCGGADAPSSMRKTSRCSSAIRKCSAPPPQTNYAKIFYK